MPDLGKLPRSLAQRSRFARFGDVPVLLAHPNWQRPAPVVLWMHGRTARKETDPGRYLRWVRAGVAACAIDLPGHGQRRIDDWDHPTHSLDVVEQVLTEIDRVVEALAAPEYESGADPLFDLDRVGIGGMSAGGMATLRRLCEPHSFRCAAVEATTGDLDALYFRREGEPGWPVNHDPERVAALDPMQHLNAFAPLPLLVMHSEGDELVPWAGQRAFVGALQARYEDAGADPGLIEVKTWPETGSPYEHAGFGRFASEAKTIQTEFLSRHLRPG